MTTTTTLTTQHEPRWRHVTQAALMLAGVLIVGSFLLLWSWNAFAVDMFGAKVMEFRHAIAAELLLAVVAATLALAGRIFGGGGRGHAGDDAQ